MKQSALERHPMVIVMMFLGFSLAMGSLSMPAEDPRSTWVMWVAGILFTLGLIGYVIKWFLGYMDGRNH